MERGKSRRGLDSGNSGRGMNKKIILLLSCLLLIFSTAFAGLNQQEFETRRAEDAQKQNIPQDWPVKSTCSGEDVNLRDGADLNSTVVGSLNAGDVCYITELIGAGTGAADGENYPWARIITAQGKIGFVYGKYLELVPEAWTRTERFAADFGRCVFFKYPDLAAVYGGSGQGEHLALAAADKNLYPHADYKLELGSSLWVFCKEAAGRTELVGAEMTAASFTVGGLTCGQTVSQEQEVSFARDMQILGWEQSADSKTDWDYRGLGAEGKKIPLHNFTLELQSGRLLKVSWRNYFL